MRISKLRRTLAVFLSMMMITLCVPLTAITASAATISAKNIEIGDTIDVGAIISLRTSPYSSGTITIYFYWKGQYNTGGNWVYRLENQDGGTSVETDNILNSYTNSSGNTITTNNGWTVVAEPVFSMATCKLYVESDKYQTFDITLNANGGTLPNGTTNPVKATNGKLTSTQLSTTPTDRDDFNFLGWYTQATGGTKITQDYTFTRDTTIYAHWEHTAHDWDYTASGNKITAKCTVNGCQYYSTGKTLTLSASDENYSGSQYASASVSADADFPVTVTDSDIKYKSADGTTYPESSTAPTKVGSYIASVTAGGVTANQAFIINGTSFTGISAANVTGTYDGTTAYSITVTGAPADAEISYGTTEGSYSSTNPEFINAGVYTVYYKVTKENYNDFKGSATVTINKAAYPNEKTASANILAGSALTDVTVTLPAVPENMSYGTPSYSGVVTSASISGSTLKFSTNDSAVADTDYYINVPVTGGIGANYVNSTITVTLRAINCTHENKSSLWSSDTINHWHECPDCHGRSDVTAHTSTEPVEENRVEATCTVDGSYDEVVYCSECNTQLSRTPKTLTAPGHEWNDGYTYDANYHWHKCTHENCTEKNGNAAHVYDQLNIKAKGALKSAATCTKPAVYYKSCICGKVGTETFLYGKRSSHTSVSADNAKAPTCTEAGKESDTICGDCGVIISEGDVIPATGHAWSKDYSYDKQYHWHECGNTNCPVTSDSEKDGYAAHISSGEATEDHDEHCTVCGYVINPALDHVCSNNVPTFVPEVPATCTTDGVKAHYVCRCEKLYSDAAATIEVTAADLRIAAHHTWSTDWSSDDAQHYHLCTVCGDKNDTAAHSYNDGVVIKEPTEDAEGEKKVTCTVCGYEKTVSIPSLDHEHSYITQNHDSEYHWNECRCGDVSDKALHTYGDWTITKLATPTADGTKERTCGVCGYVQTGTVKYVPGDDDDGDDDSNTGDINNTTDPDTNAFRSNTELTKQEIVEKCGLTAEELTAVENGESVNVFLKVEDNTAKVSAEDKALIESVLGGGDKVAMYLDIKLFKQVGDNEPTQLTNTNGEITIVFEVPESLIAEGRTYFIIRTHGDETTVINGSFDAEARTYTFVTDRFSSYAIAYNDTSAEEEDEIQKFVERLYVYMLGRASDPEGKANHVANLRNGETAVKVSYDFVYSEEFRNMGLTNEEIAERLYFTFLDRAPEKAGLANWTATLDGGCSVGHLFYGFTQSKEFGELCEKYGIVRGDWAVMETRDVSSKLTAFVSRLYTKALNRTYDVNGLNSHTANYIENHDLYQLAYDFIFSSEFTDMNLSDEDFVDTMYRTFFDREADAAGKADWLGRMKSGASREDVLAGFVGSQECADLVAKFGI